MIYLQGSTPLGNSQTNKSDGNVFHEEPIVDLDPKTHQFVGIMNLGFSIDEDTRSDAPTSPIIKRCVSFVNKTDPEFRLEPLNGSSDCINHPSNIPTTNTGVDMYYQHQSISDDIKVNINVTMPVSMGITKGPSSPFSKYLNKEKIYGTHASLRLIDSHIIGVMFQTDPQLSFCDDIKPYISDLMQDGTPLSVFTKRVHDINASTDTPRFMNALAVEAYTEKLSKAMEHVKDQINHLILSQCVFVPFRRGSVIDQDTFHNIIHMHSHFTLSRCATSLTSFFSGD
jgi:hypothetical protein